MIEQIGKTETTTYIFKDNVHAYRMATIVFVNDKFKECIFKLPTNSYDILDWYFLGQLANKIDELRIIHED